MKFIKTYWHLPEKPDKEGYYLKLQREQIYRFALSSLMLAEHHPTELYTDPEGAVIAGKLKIPFTKIHVLDKISPRYQSINDLAVMSQQKEPATLIDDDILTMGKLDIKNHPAAITVLGTDLNSLELAKSLIKVRRITDNLPFLDDSVWMNKMAYLDTALFSLSDGGILMDYVAHAREFLQLYADRLSRIEHNLVEQFIIRYWLYSYLTLNGIRFDTYFNDPLNVTLSGDSFAFSGKNIIQHILKTGNHQYADALFSRDFHQYFKFHYKETLEAIESFLHPALQHIDREDAYKRVRHALKRNYFTPEQHQTTNADNLTPTKIKRIVSIAVTMPEEAPNLEAPSQGKQKSIFLEDIYTYETYLAKVHKHFLKNKEDIHSRQQMNFVQLIKYWDSEQATFGALRISVNPYAFFHESRWKWGTYWVEGMDKSKIAELKVVYNISENPGYYLTAFVPDAETGAPNEFNLDRISAEIIQYFENEGTTEEFIELQLKDSPTYYSRIRDLLRINILYIL